MGDHEHERADQPVSHAEPGGARAREAGPRGDDQVRPDGASTGDDSVDEALRALDGLDAEPLGAHVAAFDAVHGALQDRLAEAQG